MVMHYQPLWGVREQLFLLCCPETAHRCSQTEVAGDFRTPSWRPADIAEAWRAFLPLDAILIVMPETAEEISQQPEVRKELQRATGGKRGHKVQAGGGQYISGDHPSGRLIKFPNEKVLDELVYNYSWPLFPYIWNEIKFHVAYNADLEFIASTMQRITEEELGEEMLKRIETFRDLLARTPVDELEVRERPRVIFRVSENTWLEAIVRYVVSPREAGRVKTRLIKKLLAALNAAPERVMFPAGANR
jgi:small-conductance mechanosensitive channel